MRGRPSAWRRDMRILRKFKHATRSRFHNLLPSWQHCSFWHRSRPLTMTSTFFLHGRGLQGLLRDRRSPEFVNQEERKACAPETPFGTKAGYRCMESLMWQTMVSNHENAITSKFRYEIRYQPFFTLLTTLKRSPRRLSVYR
jgi:ribosomal protein L34E